MPRRPYYTLRSIERFLFLDLLKDKAARPIVMYAGSVMVLCSLLYHWLEGWSLLDAVYFVVVSFTTIGYGDLSPTQPITKVITIFLAFNGVAVLLMLFNEIQRIRLEQIEDDARHRREMLEERQRRKQDKPANRQRDERKLEVADDQ